MRSFNLLVGHHIHLLAVLILVIGTWTPNSFADTNDRQSDTDHFDFALNSAFVGLRGRTDSYLFVNVMPEFRWRFSGINDTNSFYIALGSPLISNVNATNPASSTTTQPSPIFHTNFETSLGWAFKVHWSDAMVVVGAGYMNIQTNQSKAIYDKGPYLYAGLAISLVH